ncbi:MAG: chemotaxis response regulator protein-glutamate methylesterase [Candidatus Magnetomorum sp.]|nr:chemotaxis response regulator protein-glutamate methylesterase [Candidatus Magnetomorum sp.]
MKPKQKISVLIVDDSALVRDLLTKGLSEDPDISVIGAAADPYQARDILVLEKPDVVTLDVEMPRMDGITFLKKYMEVIPTPTIMVSSLTENNKRLTMDALEAGAVDIVPKPKAGLVDGLPAMMNDLIQKVKMAAAINVSKIKRKSIDPLQVNASIQNALDESTDRVIAIGSSTGGTEALARIIPIFPPATPGIVIVQHMPADFTASLAERLNRLSMMNVKEAQNGDRVISGQVLVAPGGMLHMKVHRYGGQYRVKLVEGEPVSIHRPSVDVLFESIATAVGKNAVAVLMTGMGKDGADGLLKIRNAGGRTFVQDEKTSVVWGMPKVGWQLGAAEAMIPLGDIPITVMNALKRS